MLTLPSHLNMHFVFSTQEHFFFLRAQPWLLYIKARNCRKIKHTRGSANTIHREVTPVNNGRQVFYRSGLIHSNCFTSFAQVLLLLFREKTRCRTHTETLLIRKNEISKR